MKPISLKEVEYLAFKIARELLSFSEPIPDFSSRFPNRLESCLAVPFQTFDGKSLYRGLIAKAAILFYLMIKNHPFQNGNKRIAVTTLLVFLYKNGHWLKVDNKKLYEFSIRVAASPSQAKEKILKEIKRFIKINLTN